jgi:hypothetical protein
MSLVLGLFAAVRERLSGAPALQEVLEKRVYFNLPEKPIYPCVVFGVDEITYNNESCRIKFNLQLLSVHQKGALPLEVAQAIEVALEETMMLDPATKATCRKASMTIDLPSLPRGGPKPHAIKQFYQAMIWRNVNA